MESVTEPRGNNGEVSATSVRGQVADDFKAMAAHKEVREFHSDTTGWHTRHRLDDFQSNLYQEPEKMLMLAILVDAISCFVKLPAAAAMARKRQWLEARNWLCSDRLDWPFAFRNVCEVLGFDPDYLRRGLLGRNQTPAPDRETHGPPPRKTYHSRH